MYPRRPISRDPREISRVEEIREIFQDRGFCTPRPKGLPEGNPEGSGVQNPQSRKISRAEGMDFLPSLGGVLTFSHLYQGRIDQNTASRDRIGQYCPAGRDGHQIHPCRVERIYGVKINPSQVMMRE